MNRYIYKISVAINSNGWVVNIFPLIVDKETEKAFFCHAEEWDQRPRTIKKTVLLEVDTKCREYHNLYQYFTFCEEGDQLKAEQILREHIIKKARQYEQELNAILVHVPNNPS